MQKFNKENIILLILVIILINNFNFFKNYYFLISKDYSTRFNKVYNFCEKESVAFVSYLIDKYKIKQNIPIKNFKVSPDPSWIFLNSANDEIDYLDSINMFNTLFKALKSTFGSNYEGDIILHLEEINELNSEKLGISIQSSDGKSVSIKRENISLEIQQIAKKL